MNEQPPWGQKKGPSSPEDLLAALIQKIRDSFAGREQGPDPGGEDSRPPGEPHFFANLGKVALVVVAVLLFQVVYSSFYTIEPGERGIILRFGKYSRTTMPGLRFKLPYIENLIKVDV